MQVLETCGGALLHMELLRLLKVYFDLVFHLSYLPSV